MGKKKQKQKVVLPPELPPKVPEDEIQVSDEDVEFVTRNQDYVGFVSKLDTRLINRHVNRVADVNEDALESLYERRLRKKLVVDDNIQPEVEPVDALPVKTLDGKVYYRKVRKGPHPSENAPVEDEAMGENEDAGKNKDVVELSKAEKWAKHKKLRKEAKKLGKEGPVVEEVQQNT